MDDEADEDDSTAVAVLLLLVEAVAVAFGIEFTDGDLFSCDVIGFPWSFCFGLVLLSELSVCCE